MKTRNIESGRRWTISACKKSGFRRIAATLGLLAAALFPAAPLAAMDTAGEPPAVARLVKDTPMWLLFTTSPDSQTAAPGDVVRFVLGTDIKVGDRVVVKSGTLATGEIVLVKKAALPGRSGMLLIRLDALQVGQTRVKITGETGDLRYKNPYSLKWPLGLFRRGDKVVIPVGTGVKAYVSEECDVPLIP